ncbi:MAG: class I SAM-dependent RNA methyltransferase [Granulosicoccus sp.]
MKDKAGWNKYRKKRVSIEPKEAELLIESLTNSGDGLGRLDERVVFVPYTMPGDKVKIKINQRKKTYALAEVVELVEPSPDRTEPKCAYFTQCGGCDWQHVPYPLQLAAKIGQLKDTLQRIGGLGEIPIQPIVSSDQPYGYRNRIQGEIRQSAFHYKRRRSDQHIAISQCEIAEKPINNWLESELGDAPKGRVEIALVDNQVIVLPINENNSTELGFRQVNSHVSQVLTEKLLSIIEQSICKNIIDLYCGRGTWTNLIATKHPDKEIIGVDSSPDNIKTAKETAQIKKLNNVRFQLSTVEKTIRSLPVSSSLCIVDPPRAGLDSKVCESLIQSRPEELIYISCHPATLARDLKVFTEAGYSISNLVPLDMFPQTAHLESLVQLTAKNQ